MYIKQDQEWVAVAHEAFEASRLKKHYARLEEIHLDKLKELSKEQNSVGSIYRFMMIERKGSIDYASIPELHLVDIEKYRKEPVVSWKLTNDWIAL
jgi:hypothetical protein